MRLGLSLGSPGAQPAALAAAVGLTQQAEQAGFESVWVAEAYGTDAATVLAYLAARTDRIRLGSGVLQLVGRTPANTAMTAITLDALSGGRLLLGLGASGPQVVEGWHGVAYGRPLARTREYLAIVRAAIARQAPLVHQGEYYQIPYAGPDATGLGKPLRAMTRPVRDRVPIYLGALGPRNVALAAELADGWLAYLYCPEREDVFADALAQGRARRTAPGELAVVPIVYLAAGPDLAACRDRLRPRLALYVGGMGAPGRNFYFDLVCRYGFGDQARRIQAEYTAGRVREAAGEVTDAMVDRLALAGPVERIADRLAAWRESRATTVVLGTDQPELFGPLAEVAAG